MDDTTLYLLVGAIGLTIHFAIVIITYFVAKGTGRNGLGWAGAAMICGPVALVVMYFRKRERPEEREAAPRKTRRYAERPHGGR